MKAGKQIQFFFYLLLTFRLLPTAESNEIKWEHVSPGTGGGWMAVDYDPADENTIYAASDMGTTFKSVDGGNNWHDLTPALLQACRCGGPRAYISHILVNPLNPEIVYISASGVVKSADGGKTWRESLKNRKLGGEFVAGGRIAMHPENPDILYACFCTGKTYKTEDGGHAWNYLTELGGLCQAITITKDGVYIAIEKQGIYKSTDNGKSWKLANKGLPHFNFLTLVSGGSALYAFLATQCEDGNRASWKGGVYKSIDGGDNWFEGNQGLDIYVKEKNFTRPCQLALSPTHPNVLYMTVAGITNKPGYGIYRSDDGAGTWRYIASDLAYGTAPNNERWSVNNLGAFAVSPVNPDHFMITDIGHLYRSMDGGETLVNIANRRVGRNHWTTTGIENLCAASVAVDPFDSRRLYLGFADCSFFNSNDGGISFKSTRKYGLKYYNTCNCIIIDPDNPRRIYAGTAMYCDVEKKLKGEVAISDNYGNSWWSTAAKPDCGLPEGFVWSLLLDPQSPKDRRTLYAAVVGHGIFKSADGGTNWFGVNSGLPPVQNQGQFGYKVVKLALSNSGILYALLSVNSAAPYARHGGGNDPWKIPRLSDASGFKHGVVYASADGGGHWNKLGMQGMPDVGLYDLIVVAAKNEYLYACGEGGEVSGDGAVYRSVDNGATWEKCFKADRPVICLAYDYRNPQIIYAGLDGHYRRDDYGVWLSKDGGNKWQSANYNFGHTSVTVLYTSKEYPGQVWAGTFGNSFYKGTLKKSCLDYLLMRFKLIFPQKNSVNFIF